MRVSSHSTALPDDFSFPFLSVANFWCKISSITATGNPRAATIKSCKKSEITHPRWFVKTLPFFRFRCASTAGQKHPLNVKNCRAYWSISGSPTLGRRYGARGNYYLVIILQAKVIIDLHVCQFPPTRSARMVFILSPSRKVIKG